MTCALKSDYGKTDVNSDYGKTDVNSDYGKTDVKMPLRNLHVCHKITFNRMKICGRIWRQHISY